MVAENREYRADIEVGKLDGIGDAIVERSSSSAVISVWIDPKTTSPPGTRSASAASRSIAAWRSEQNSENALRLKYWNLSRTTT